MDVTPKIAGLWFLGVLGVLAAWFAFWAFWECSIYEGKRQFGACMIERYPAGSETGGLNTVLKLKGFNLEYFREEDDVRSYYYRHPSFYGPVVSFTEKGGIIQGLGVPPFSCSSLQPGVCNGTNTNE